ncbi:hypothetical protein BVX98_07055 [bacterium F11]|nr:hypothetical protein BVX98_07055 [bacterium F11]
MRFSSQFCSVFFFFTLVSTIPLFAEKALTLKEAHQRAIENSSGIEASENAIQAARVAGTEVSRNRLPRIQFHSSVTRGNHPVYVFGTLLTQGEFAAKHFDVSFLNDPPDRTNFRNALELGVPLFTGFQLSDQRKIAKLQEKKATLYQELITQQTSLELVKSYFELVNLQQSRASLERRIASSKKELDSAKKLMKRGRVFGSDFYAAQALLQGLQAELSMVQARSKASKERLRILLNEDQAESLHVDAHLSEPSYTIPSEKDILAKAHQRPDVKMSRLDKKMAVRSAKIDKRQVVPRVEAFGQIETNTEDFGRNPSNRMGGIQLQTPFGDPSYYAKNKKATFLIKAATAESEYKQDQSEMEVLSLLRAYEGTLEVIPFIKSAKENAAISLEKFRPLYREGRQSVLEVLRAEKALADASRGYDQAIFAAHLTYTQLQMAMGQLRENVIDELNQHLVYGSEK